MTPFVLMSALSLLGYHLSFDAEMNGPPDMTSFVYDFDNGATSVPSNFEAESYVPFDPTDPATPFSFANGALTINATPVPTAGQPYRSGLLSTSGIFAQSTGYFEIRAAMPAGQGFWPAFWLIAPAYYPEIDIFEQPNNTGSDSQYWVHITTPTNSSGGFYDSKVDLFSGYHRYGFLWTANAVQYVFDGQVLGDPVPLPPSLIGLRMAMVANLAVGGPQSWPGVPLNGAASSYSIDYIRAFSTDPAVPAVAQQPVSSPDGVDTTPTLVPPVPATPPSLGRGIDTLALQVSEDAWQGDAQFTIAVDGHAVGGTQTATASHAFGQSQTFTVLGDYGVGRHVVTINVLNAASGTGGDRALYVTGGSLDGATIGTAVVSGTQIGPNSFAFSAKRIPPVIIGAGPDSFIFGLSETPHTANAHYTIAVDGVQQGGTLIAAAQQALGQSQSVTVAGSFGIGAHRLTLTLGADATPGSTAASSLQVDSLSYDGRPVPDAVAAFNVRGPSSLAIPARVPDSLVLGLLEDAWQGDAIAQISVDGVPLGTVTVTAPNWQSNPQVVQFSGDWGGPQVGHVVTVNFTNDLYTSPYLDRNLYVHSIVLDGTTITLRQVPVKAGGPVQFTYVVPPGPASVGWVGGN